MHIPGYEITAGLSNKIIFHVNKIPSFITISSATVPTIAVTIGIVSWLVHDTVREPHGEKSLEDALLLHKQLRFMHDL